MEQYPNGLYVKNVIGSGKDAVGNAIQGDVIWTRVSDCREETKNAGRTINVGGVTHTYNAYILTPTTCPIIDNGTTVEVRDKAGNPVLSLKTILYKKTQLHCRIWV